jgi:hypothetical protein
MNYVSIRSTRVGAQDAHQNRLLNNDVVGADCIRPRAHAMRPYLHGYAEYLRIIYVFSTCFQHTFQHMSSAHVFSTGFSTRLQHMFSAHVFSDYCGCLVWKASPTKKVVSDPNIMRQGKEMTGSAVRASIGRPPKSSRN